MPLIKTLSIKVIIIGVIVDILLTGAFDAVFQFLLGFILGLLHLGMNEFLALQHTLFVKVINIFLGLLATVIAGYLVAKLAPQKKLLNSFMMGILGALLALIFVALIPKERTFYNLFGSLLTIPLGVLGGWLYTFINVKTENNTISTAEIEQISDTTQENKLKGLKGWLIVIMVIFFLKIITSAKTVIYDVLVAIKIKSFITLLMIEIGMNMVMILWAVFILYLYFKRKKIFSNQVIKYQYGVIVFLIIDLILLFIMFPPNTFTPEIQKLVTAEYNAIWQAVVLLFIFYMYFKRSVRVRETFIEE